MQSSYIVVGIIVLLFIVLFSTKYIVAEKYTLREMLNATNKEIVTKSELPKQDGIAQNFTYSIWCYVNNWNYKNGEYKPIFGKFNGLSSETTTETNYDAYFNAINDCLTTSTCNVKPSPVVTFTPIQNDILIYIPYTDDVSTSVQPFKCLVQNIPIQKWVNLSITLYKKTLDVYINGKLHKTCVLPNIPNLSIPDGETGDILITPGGGFDGYTSKFQFHPEALNPQEIWNIYSNGFGSLASSLGDYQIKMSLIENGNETNTLTI
jgi:hypothetical protein